jgi:pyruvate ferredoxin oxidoreductase beta subunit
VGYINDLRKKISKAKEADGPAFLHIHAPCPTGWGYEAAQTIELAKLAVTSRCWNLYEMVAGTQVTITKKIKKASPVEDYLKPQKRFKGINADALKQVQAQVDKDYAQLELIAGLACAA